MLIQSDGPLSPPFPQAVLDTDFIIFLFSSGGRLPADLNGGIGRHRTVAEFPLRRPVIIADLQDRLTVIAVQIIVLIVIRIVSIDFRPGMIRIVRGVSGPHRQIHGYHRGFIILIIHSWIVP